MDEQTKREKAHRLYQESWDSADRGDLDCALRLIGQAIDLSNLSLYEATRGEYLLAAGRQTEAKLAAESATRLNSRNYHAWALLGTIQGRLGESVEAAASLEKAVLLKPNHNYYTLLAAVQAEFDPEAAISSAKKALELHPDWEEAKLVISVARQRLGMGSKTPSEP